MLYFQVFELYLDQTPTADTEQDLKYIAKARSRCYQYYGSMCVGGDPPRGRA